MRIFQRCAKMRWLQPSLFPRRSPVFLGRAHVWRNNSDTRTVFPSIKLAQERTEWKKRCIDRTCWAAVSRKYFQTLSKRQLADMEETLVSALDRSVRDPVLDKNLASLGWLSSRCVAVSADGQTVELLLRLPSLLHPELENLKDLVASEATRVLNQWRENHVATLSNKSDLSRVNVEAIAGSATPFMTRLVENPDEMVRELGPGLENVSHVIAVYSCKGGVGKSTVAVNLAYELARLGGRVGLLDLDLYGPSLPILVQPKDKTVRRSRKGSGMVCPIEHGGIRLLSLGFVNTNSGVQGSGTDNGAAIMRGPLVVKVVAQLLKGTDWGELDVLVLDLPPGTGDVQLAVCQDLALSGAVAVSTPSKLATTDTRKGIEMFTSLGVPTLAVVENMSYFVVSIVHEGIRSWDRCDLRFYFCSQSVMKNEQQCEGGTKHYPFGKGSVNDSTKLKGPTTLQFPISSAANDATESAAPLCLTRPANAAEDLGLYEQLARTVSRELLRVHYGETESQHYITFPDEHLDDTFAVATLQLNLEKTTSPASILLRLFSESGAIQKRIHPAALRSRDPKTGDIIEDSPFRDQIEEASDHIVAVHHLGASGTTKKISPSLSPIKVQRKGRYGFAVEWSDGATIIYSKASLARAAGGHIVADGDDVS